MLKKLFQEEWFIWKHWPFKREISASRTECLKVTAIFLLFLAFIYHMTNQYGFLRLDVSWRPHTMFTMGDGSLLDRNIPFIPGTIHIYNTLLAFFFVHCFLYPLTQRGQHEVRILLQTQILLTCTATIFFVLLPSPVDMRDQVQNVLQDMNHGAFHKRLFETLYFIDTHYNSWPCLHIAHPLLITLTVQKWLQKPISKIILWTWVVLLLVSIATTKQHFVWDLLTGIITGLILYKISIGALRKVKA